MPDRVLRDKVIGKDEADSHFAKLREAGFSVVQCHGVFDLLHTGHVAHLEEARALADFLVVSVTADKFVDKGPNRPYFSLAQRVTMLAALEAVDFVLESDSPDATEAISSIKPDLYFKGPDYSDTEADLTGNILRERKEVERYGGRIAFSSSPSLSSSVALNSAGLVQPPDTRAWLDSLVENVDVDSILSHLKNIVGLNVVIVGEAILDEYIFVDPLGKSGKDPVLAFRKNSRELQVGGSIAIAKHCSGLGARTTLLTRTGSDSGRIEIEKSLESAQIKLIAQRSETQKTIVKSRFVDERTGAKVFETYEISDELVTDEEDQQFASIVQEHVAMADIVLVADYGHGLMTDRVIETLHNADVVLAVNTQSNAGNRGFNSISRYSQPDIVCLNGDEISLELRKKRQRVEDLVSELGRRIGTQWIVVTDGARGMVIWSEETGCKRIPTFSQVVTDRVGAGDALFVAVSLLIHSGADHDVVGFFGNLAGTTMISELGNRRSLRSQDMARHATYLLKR